MLALTRGRDRRIREVVDGVLVASAWLFPRRKPLRASRASLDRRAAVHEPRDDPAQDYFADGVTENLTTELSHIRDSFVIARNTAFTYKGKAVDAKEIGRELGVRYVLEGTVHRDGNRCASMPS